MLRSRFLWKLYAGYVFFILLTAGIIGALLALRIETETLADIDRHLRTEAVLLRDLATVALADPQAPGLQERVAEVGSEVGTRLTVIDAAGWVVADSWIDPGPLDNHGLRPEVRQARESGVGAVSRYSRSTERRLRYLALPIRDGDGELLGYARTSVPLTAIADRLAQLRNAVALAVGIAILVALLLGFLHARRVTRPVLSMATAAELIAAGDYEEEVQIESKDELGTLARAFNTMSRELRRSIATVEADRNTLTAILSSMLEGVVAVDRDERIVHVNEVAGRLFGVVPERALSKPIWEVTRIREIAEMLSETLREEEPVQRVVRRPGSPDQILDLRASPLRAGGGRLAGAVLVLDDVTQLRQLETMRRDFVGNVSHELKTPVTAIRGLVETLLDDPEVEPVRRVRYLSKIRNQADRLASLVGDLLSLSRLESGGIVELVAIDVRDAVEESIRGLRPTAEARKICVVPELPERPIVVEVDEDALEQAVSNLLDNALKYTPEGGTVHVRLTEEADEGRATIEVRDTGIGIEPLHRERIFERFYRVDTARSRELGGTGLGLAIVKHIAQALRGEVSVDSVPGEGSTFRIHLPLADAGAPEELTADVASPVEAPG